MPTLENLAEANTVTGLRMPDQAMLTDSPDYIAVLNTLLEASGLETRVKPLDPRIVKFSDQFIENYGSVRDIPKFQTPRTLTLEQMKSIMYLATGREEVEIGQLDEPITVPAIVNTPTTILQTVVVVKTKTEARTLSPDNKKSYPASVSAWNVYSLAENGDFALVGLSFAG